MQPTPNLPKHLAQAKELIASLTPTYFAPNEAEDFVEYLTKHIEDYFVIVDEHLVVGCGGINYFPDKKLARLSWDMIHPNMQGKGLGEILVHFRIEHIKAHQLYDTIEVRTSQHAESFYRRFGFHTVKTAPNFWAKDLHLVQMKLNIKDS